MSRYNTNKDFAFYKWIEQYERQKPTVLNDHETMQECLEYAESMFREAFDAGYEACKEDVSNL